MTSESTPSDTPPNPSQIVVLTPKQAFKHMSLQGLSHLNYHSTQLSIETVMIFRYTLKILFSLHIVFNICSLEAFLRRLRVSFYFLL